MDLINILFAKALNKEDATKEYVNEAIKALKGEVNADLDTLEELSKALGNDPDFFLTVKNEIDGFKTELVTGKDAATENTRFAIGTAEQTLEVPSMEEFNGLKDDVAGKLPKTPTEWPEWTNEEQTAIREKIVVENGGDFELLVDTVLEEETSMLKVQLPKSVRECMYHIWFFNKNDTSTRINVMCIDKDTNMFCQLAYETVPKNYGLAIDGYFRYNGELNEMSVIGYYGIVSNSSESDIIAGGGNLKMNKTNELSISKTDAFMLYFDDFRPFNIGATIRVWGR